jgi:hypothetical protein
MEIRGGLEAARGESSNKKEKRPRRDSWDFTDLGREMEGSDEDMWKGRAQPQS